MSKKIVLVILNLIIYGFIFAQELDVINIEKSVYKFKIGSEQGFIGIEKKVPKEIIRELSMPGVEKSEGPSAFTFDEEANLYILDSVNNRINKYNKDFQFIEDYPVTINSYISQIQVYSNGFLLFDHDGDADFLTFYDNKGTNIWSYLNLEINMDVNTLIYLEKSNVIINYDKDKLFCIYDLGNDSKITESESNINNYLKKEINTYVKNGFLYINNKKYRKDINYLQSQTKYKSGRKFIGFDLELNNYFDNVERQILIGNSNTKTRIAYPRYDLHLKENEKRADLPGLHPSGDIYFLVYCVENATVELRLLENTWAPEAKEKWEKYYENNESTNVHVNDIKICNDNLRLRKEEATTSEVITTMQKGTKVKILKLGKSETIDGISSNWVQVEVQSGGKDRDGKEIKSGTVGWCYGGYLE